MTVPHTALTEIKHIVAARLGLDYPQGRLGDLERAVIRTAEILGVPLNSDQLVPVFSGESPAADGIRLLGEFLTVGETYFFREKNVLQFFLKKIIPDIIERKQTADRVINIWSAGCCTGEEPYTIAILLKESGLNLRDWKINIVATDINMNYLEKARIGIYPKWSFRETDPVIRQRYFRQVQQNWAISPEVKAMVSFFRLNLAELHSLPGVGPLHKADVIFCRNVLMYFTPQLIHRTARFFFDFLDDPGWFIPSQVELNDQYFGIFRSVSCGNCLVYQKSSRDPDAPARPLPDEKHSRHSVLKKTAAIPARPKPVTIPEMAGKKRATDEPDPEILYETGQYKACADVCQARIKGQGATAREYALLIKSLGNLGKLTAAREVCEQLITKDPGNANSHYLYATILLESGDQDGAINALKKVVYLDQDHLLGHFTMFTMLRKKGNHKLAEIHRKNVISLIKDLNDNDPVKGAEGLTAGSLRQITGSVK